MLIQSLRRKLKLGILEALVREDPRQDWVLGEVIH
jgi:hypothetical protein